MIHLKATEESVICTEKHRKHIIKYILPLNFTAEEWMGMVDYFLKKYHEIDAERRK